MRSGMLLVAVCLLLVGTSTSGRAGEDAPQPTNIAAQGLAPALQRLAKERGVQVVYRSELLLDHWTRGVRGNLTFDEALAQLLDATGLTYRYLADKAITIVPAPVHGESSPSGTMIDRGKGHSR